MTSDAARIALLEEWMRDKEGENLEFKEAKNRFSFEELGQYCYRAGKRRWRQNHPRCHQQSATKSRGLQSL